MVRLRYRIALVADPDVFVDGEHAFASAGQSGVILRYLASHLEALRRGDLSPLYREIADRIEGGDRDGEFVFNANGEHARAEWTLEAEKPSGKKRYVN